MPRFQRPEFEDVMLRARKATDHRSEFEVYSDVARRIVTRELTEKLKDLPVSEACKAQIIESEIYAKAQPAHLSDVSTYKPVNLLAMLEQLSVLGTLPEEQA